MSGKPTPLVDNSLALAEKAELEQLRIKKATWDQEKESMIWQRQEDTTEKARLIQEISNLQLKVTQLSDDRTRDILAIKSKETQLVRSLSDLTSSRKRVAELEEEVSRFKRQRLNNNNNSRTSSPEKKASMAMSPTKPSNLNRSSPQRGSGVNGKSLSTTSSNVSITSEGSRSNSPVKLALGAGEISMDAPSRQTIGGSRHTGNFQEFSTRESNQFGGPTRYSARNYLPSTLTAAAAGGETGASGIPAYNSSRRQQGLDENGKTSNTSGSGLSNNNNGTSNWKRAAEVTSQLKARIEAMKAKQNQNRTLR